MPPQTTPLSRRAILRTALHATAIAALLPRMPGSRAAAAAPAVHPIVGAWLATTPEGPAHVVFTPYGEVVMAWPHSEDFEAGTSSYTTAATGAWRPTGPYSMKFLVIEILSESGLAADYATLECELVVDTVKPTFRGTHTTRTVASGANRDEANTLPEVTGLRMLPEQ